MFNSFPNQPVFLHDTCLLDSGDCYLILLFRHVFQLCFQVVENAAGAEDESFHSLGVVGSLARLRDET